MADKNTTVKTAVITGYGINADNELKQALFSQVQKWKKYTSRT